MGQAKLDCLTRASAKTEEHDDARTTVYGWKFELQIARGSAAYRGWFSHRCGWRRRRLPRGEGLAPLYVCEGIRELITCAAVCVSLGATIGFGQRGQRDVSQSRLVKRNLGADFTEHGGVSWRSGLEYR